MAVCPAPGNLNRYVRERDLDRMFSKMGRIRELELMVNAHGTY